MATGSFLARPSPSISDAAERRNLREDDLAGMSSLSHAMNQDVDRAVSVRQSLERGGSKGVC